MNEEKVKLLNVFSAVTDKTDNPVLKRAEIDLLSETIRSVMAEFESQKIYGSVILDGQRDEEYASLLYKCNLRVPAKFSEKGNFNVPDSMAARAIDDMLQPEAKNPYRHSFVLNARSLKEAVCSGLYQYDHAVVMVLNANGGRFLCGVHLIDGESGNFLLGETIVLLMCLGMALERMFPGDAVLRRSRESEFFATTEKNAVFTEVSPWSFMEAVVRDINYSDDKVNGGWRKWYREEGEQLRGEGLFVK